MFSLGAEQSESPIIPDTTRTERFYSGLPGGFAAKRSSSRGRELTWDVRHSLPSAIPKAVTALLWLLHQLTLPRQSLLSTWTYPTLQVSLLLYPWSPCSLGL